MQAELSRRFAEDARAVDRSLFVPLCGLVALCTLSSTLALARVAVTGSWGQLYLGWNLFLACVPLVFAVLFLRSEMRGARGSTKLILFAAWLAFLPNAPYIMTDFVHLRFTAHPRFWTDLVLLLLFAWAGALSGFISLYVMQRIVAVRRGVAMGWLFVFVVAVLTGIGIYLGRVERWNTWDLLLDPFAVLRDVFQLIAEPRARLRLPALFTLVVLIGYVSLYSLLGTRTAFTSHLLSPSARK